MFTFSEDRKQQGTPFGPGGSVCMADQTKYRSIWGCVEGKLVGPWTGSMIQNGEIRSADGKACLGGAPVIVNGKPHIVSDGDSKMQEFQIPIEDAQKWNAYEAKQGNDQIRAFLGKEESKAATLGRAPELKIDSLDVHMTPPQIAAEQHRSEASSSAPKAKRERTPAQQANDQRLRDKAAAKKANISPPT